MPLKDALSEFRSFVTSRRVIPILKGTLAYLLAFVVIFLKGFDNLNTVPASYVSMVIITIAGMPGKSIGACVQASVLAILGVGVGSVMFIILAYLGHAPVAQGFVFALFVYILSLVKAAGLRWFGFSLLAILQAFNGIYTSLTLDGTFHGNYLLEYLKSYLWGAAIVLFVNICVFPRTSERELREALVLSLQHVSTLVNLLGKAYHLRGTPEEKVTRETLVQQVGADFAFLTRVIEETSVEVNWSRFSHTDYQLFVEKTRAMQRALISAHTTLLAFDPKDAKIFRENFLPHMDNSFWMLRRDINQTLDDLVKGLGCGRGTISDPTGYADLQDIERQRANLSNPNLSQPNKAEEKEQLAEVSRQLKEYYAAEDAAATAATVSTPPTIPMNIDRNLGPSTSKSPSQSPTAGKGDDTDLEKGTDPGAKSLKRDFDDFKNRQHDVITQILVSGGLHGDDDSLRIHEPLPSIHELYGADHHARTHKHGAATSSATAANLPSASVSRAMVSTGEEDDPPLRVRRRRAGVTESKVDVTTGEEVGEGLVVDDEDVSDAESETVTANHSLIRVYSVLFSFDRFVQALEEYHSAVTLPRRAGLHFHLFELLYRPGQKFSGGHDGPSNPERELSIKEALAVLEEREYVPPPADPWRWLAAFKNFLGSKPSVFAAKTAAAASVFATLIFVETTRSFFVQYGLTGGLLTVVVALYPTLGQSLVTFVFQIAGSGFGYVSGLIILEIFRGVGGYAFNPYGITCLVGLYALPLQYLLYEKPIFFVLSLLAMNGTGVLVFTEWLYVQHLGVVTFDSPALRLGKALAALAIALGIALIFQLFVLRAPARQSLREALGHLVYSNLAYNTILQAYVRSVMPADPNHKAKAEAVRIVEQDLLHRERKLQAEIIALGPLLVFARAEPAFGKPFKGAEFIRVIQANQIMLDRLREARAAIGVQPFGDFILIHFVSVLSAYRRRATRLIKTGLYLSATSIMSKSPLPHDIPNNMEVYNNSFHDALVLSATLARSENGAEMVRSGDFTRYWFYLLSIGTMPTQMNVIIDACKDLFGELEDDPRLK